MKYDPFWIAVAILLYFTMTEVIFVLDNYIFRDPTSPLAVLIWAVHNFFNTMKNFIFALGIYFLGKTKQSAFERLGMPKDGEDYL